MKFKFLYIISALLLVASSCEKRHIDDYVVDGMVYLLNVDNVEDATINEVVFYDIEDSGVININAYGGGFHGVNAAVSLVQDEDALVTLNEANGTAYELLPEGCYSFKQKSISVTPDKRSAQFELVMDYVALEELQDRGNYVLAISLVSKGADVNPKLKTVFYHFTMKKTELNMMNAGPQNIIITPTDTEEIVADVVIGTYFDNPLECGFSIDYSDVVLNSAVQSAFGKSANPLPEDAYEFVPVSVLPQGQNQVTAQLKIDPTKLSFGTYHFAVSLVEADYYLDPDPNKTTVVYEIVFVPEFLSKNVMTVPYINTKYYGKSAADGLTTAYFVDGDPESLVQLAWKAKDARTDPYFTEWTVNNNNGSYLPWIFIVDLGQEKNVCGAMITRRNGRNWNLFPYVDVYLSNDTSNDHILSDSLGKNITDPSTEISKNVSEAWGEKEWVKACRVNLLEGGGVWGDSFSEFCEPTKARYVKFVVEKATDMKLPVVVIAEVDIYGY